MIRSVFKLLLIFIFHDQLLGSYGEWNENHTGRSKFYKELELDTFVKSLKNMDRDVVVSMYGDHCSHCQDIHSMQEKGAEKILKETDDVKFARLDVKRFGGPRLVVNQLQKQYPNFDKVSPMRNLEDGESTLELPQMYLFGKGLGKVTRIPHGEIGWGPKGWQNIRKWVRQNANDGQGYDYPKKKKKGAKKTEAETDEL